jgi:type IV secretory pathway VirB2 component (pilin)
MTTISAIAVVMAIVQFVKNIFPFIQGNIARALVIVVSVAVTLYKFIGEGLPLNLVAVMFLTCVIVGALSAYSLVKVAGGNGTNK